MRSIKIVRIGMGGRFVNMKKYETIPYTAYFILLLLWIILLCAFPPDVFPSNFYTVIKGDTLSKIAQQELSDWKKWRYLMEINKLESTLLVPGQELKLIDWTNKVIMPALTKWVYKHSMISRSMAAQIVEGACRTKYPLLLLALMKTESHFIPTAVSKLGAMGLGQVMYYHEAKLIKIGILVEMRDIFEIPIGVKATEFMWKSKLKRAHGDVVTALTFYYGEKSEEYINGILGDYYTLRGLCSGEMG